MLQSANRDSLFRAEPFAQKIHEPRVLFNCQHFAGFFQKQFRQRPKSRPDFQNLVRRRNLRRVHDAAELVAVVQKILAERFGQLDVALAPAIRAFRRVSLQNLRQRGNGFRKLRFGDGQRRREADDVAKFAFGQENVAAMQHRFDRVQAPAAVAGLPSGKFNSTPAIKPRPRVELTM